MPRTTDTGKQVVNEEAIRRRLEQWRQEMKAAKKRRLINDYFYEENEKRRKFGQRSYKKWKI